MTFCVKKRFDKNYIHNFHGLFRERRAAMNSQEIRDALNNTDIFLSDPSGASDDSTEDKTYKPPDFRKQEADTSSDSEYGKSG